MTEPASDWVVERMDPDRDIDDVLAISADAFAHPLTRAALESDLAHAERTWILVIRPAGGSHRPAPVVGYCSVWLIFDELHINTLAVRSEWRQRGAARQLLAFALETATKAGASRATLEVRRGNAAARRLYESLGFVVAGTRRDYYANPRDDALILWRESPASA